MLNIQPLPAPALAAWLADPARPRPLLLDVREPWEFTTCRLEGSTSMPLQTLPVRFAEIDLDQAIVCICHHGARSMQAAAYLAGSGARQVYNLTGGVAAWAHQVDPAFPTY